jgi:antitoxin component of RelBE/YafQ-DinJ toxin-antitoxin module
MREKLSYEVRARVPRRWKEEIDRIAERYSLTNQDVIRQAICFYLSRDPLNNQAIPLELPGNPPATSDTTEPCSERKNPEAPAAHTEPAASGSLSEPAEALSSR